MWSSRIDTVLQLDVQVQYLEAVLWSRDSRFVAVTGRPASLTHGLFDIYPRTQMFDLWNGSPITPPLSTASFVRTNSRTPSFFGTHGDKVTLETSCRAAGRNLTSKEWAQHFPWIKNPGLLCPSAFLPSLIPIVPTGNSRPIVRQ